MPCPPSSQPRTAPTGPSLSSSHSRHLLAHQRVAKCFTRPREPRHDRAHRDPHRVSELSIGEAFQFSKPQQLPGSIGKVSHRPFDQRGVIRLKQQRFGSCRGQYVAVALLIELVGCYRVRTVALPRRAGVANDSKEPCPSISSGERLEVSKGAKRCLLHDIVYVIGIAYEPASQTPARRQVGKNHLMKVLACFDGQRRTAPHIVFGLDSHAASLKSRPARHHQQHPHNTRTCNARATVQPYGWA